MSLSLRFLDPPALGEPFPPPLFTFLDFPGEIRNQIYALLLLLPSISTKRVMGDPPIHPNILRACKKVHYEAQQLLYSANTFIAHPNLLTGLPRLRHYYNTISNPRLISLIRRFHITIRLDCDPNFPAKRAEDSFTGVEELTIQVFQAQFGSSDNKALTLFEGVRGVKRARIYGSVQAFPEYVQFLENAVTSPVGSVVGEFDKEVWGAHVRGNDDYDIWTHGGR